MHFASTRDRMNLNSSVYYYVRAYQIICLA